MFAPFPYIFFGIGLMCVIVSHLEEDDIKKLQRHGYTRYGVGDLSKKEGKKK